MPESLTIMHGKAEAGDSLEGTWGLGSKSLRGPPYLGSVLLPTWSPRVDPLSCLPSATGDDFTICHQKSIREVVAEQLWGRMPWCDPQLFLMLAV